MRQRWAARGDVRLPYVVQGPDDGRRLVYAHGIHGSGAVARDSVAPLLERGWTIATFDQRGHHRATPVRDARDYDPGEMGADLIAVMDALGWTDAWIGGESMGAATSMAAACSTPERVRGLLQVVPAICERPLAVADNFSAMADVLDRDGIEATIALMTAEIERLGGKQSQIDRLADLRLHDPSSIALAWRTVPTWVMSGIVGRLAAFGFPVLVAGWRDEPVHPFGIAEEFAASARHGVLVELSLEDWLENRSTIGRAIADPLDAVCGA